jgi:hypothetical protein
VYPEKLISPHLVNQKEMPVKKSFGFTINKDLKMSLFREKLHAKRASTAPVLETLTPYSTASSPQRLQEAFLR